MTINKVSQNSKLSLHNKPVANLTAENVQPQATNLRTDKRITQNNTSNTSKLEGSKIYLQIYTLLITISFISIGVTNFIANPQKLFNQGKLLGLKEEKPFENWLDYGRYHKANQIARGNYDTVMFGNSRVFEGLEPIHPSFANNTYNAGLPLANIYEIEKIFNYTRKNNQLKKIIIGLDLGQFSDRRSLEGDFKKSRFAGEIPYYTTYFSNIFSLQQFNNSLNKIKFNLQDGSIPENSYFKIVNGFKQKDKNYRSNPQKQFISYAEAFLGDKGYLNFPYSEEKLNILRKIIADCRREGIEVHLFISPVHAWQLEFMQVSNIFPLFEQWKRDLVDVIAEDAVNNPEQSPILLWDFSGYNAITTEPVPIDSDRQMQWFNDPCHYKKEVGDIILTTIFNSDERIPQFGVLIDRNNLQNHLLNIRQQQAIYQHNNARQIKIIEDI